MYKKATFQNCLLFASTRAQPRILLGSVLVIFLVFCVVFCFFSLCDASCTPYVASVSGLSILDFRFSLTFIYMQIAYLEFQIKSKFIIKWQLKRSCSNQYTQRVSGINIIRYAQDKRANGNANNLAVFGNKKTKMITQAWPKSVKVTYG